jgi:hypothetical protein
MLSRRVRSAAISVALVAAIVAATAGLADAQPERTGALPAGSPTSSPASVTCPPGQVPDPISQICEIVVTGPPSGGSSSSSPGGGGGAQVCTLPFNQQVVPCSLPQWGWWDGSDCYLILANPQPPASDPVWQGNAPGTGAIYLISCYVLVGGVPQLQKGMGQVWRLTPPGGGITPAQVAQIAIKKLTLYGPTNGIAPPASSYALVGMPVWLWTVADSTHWGPQPASASAGGITVTATAQATKIVWHMGDGSTKECDNPGTIYDPSKATTVSPTCSYVYSTTSANAPGQKFSLYGVTTWVISWSGGGASGTLTTTVQSPAVGVKVESAQALATP